MQNSRRGDSPRWGRNRSLGNRSRHAQRALGVFPSRSFSAGAAGATLTSSERDSVATKVYATGLSQNDGVEGTVVSQDDPCGRRLSMGDPRVTGMCPVRTNTMVRTR